MLQFMPKTKRHLIKAVKIIYSQLFKLLADKLQCFMQVGVGVGGGGGGGGGRPGSLPPTHFFTQTFIIE